MNTHRLSSSSVTAAAPPALTFALPGIWPDERRLLVDPLTRTALVFSLVGVETFPLVRAFALTPSGTSVLLALLQAYPHFCSYRDLFLTLHPQTVTHEGHERGGDRTLLVPPVRRALKSLLPMLRACGLRAVALRGQGYLLAAATTPAEHDTVPSAPLLSREASNSLR